MQPSLGSSVFELNPLSSYLVQESIAQGAAPEYDENERLDNRAIPRLSPTMFSSSFAKFPTSGEAWENIPVIIRNSFCQVLSECKRLQSEVNVLKRENAARAQVPNELKDVEMLTVKVEALEQNVRLKPSIAFISECLDRKANRSDVYAMIPPQEIDLKGWDSRFLRIEEKVETVAESFALSEKFSEKWNDIENRLVFTKMLQGKIADMEIKGRKNEKKIKDFTEMVERMENSESRILESVGHLSQALKGINGKINNFDGKAKQLEEKLSVLDSKLKGVLARIDSEHEDLEHHMQEVERHQNDLDKKPKTVVRRSPTGIQTKKYKDAIINEVRGCLKYDIYEVLGMDSHNHNVSFDELRDDVKLAKKQIKRIKEHMGELEGNGKANKTNLEETQQSVSSANAQTEKLKETAEEIKSHQKRLEKHLRTNTSHLKQQIDDLEQKIKGEQHKMSENLHNVVNENTKEVKKQSGHMQLAIGKIKGFLKTLVSLETLEDKLANEVGKSISDIKKDIKRNKDAVDEIPELKSVERHIKKQLLARVEDDIGKNSTAVSIITKLCSENTAMLGNLEQNFDKELETIRQCSQQVKSNSSELSLARKDRERLTVIEGKLNEVLTAAAATTEQPSLLQDTAAQRATGNTEGHEKQDGEKSAPKRESHTDHPEATESRRHKKRRHTHRKSKKSGSSRHGRRKQRVSQEEQSQTHAILEALKQQKRLLEEKLAST
jgi:hypothetical protein